MEVDALGTPRTCFGIRVSGLFLIVLSHRPCADEKLSPRVFAQFPTNPADGNPAWREFNPDILPGGS